MTKHNKELKINLQERLYKNLPNIYLREDAKNGYALRKVLEVFGVGFNELEKYIQDLSYSYDIDNCPSKFLPLIAKFYGIQFPYAFDEATQRRFLKVVPKLYEHKGTDLAFKYLAREIFGQATVTKSWTPIRDSATSEEDWEESEEWKKLYVRAEVDGETFMLNDKANQFNIFAEVIRPVNTIIVPHIAFFYQDLYDMSLKVNEKYTLDFLHCDDKLENAIKAKKYTSEDLIKLKVEEEVYNASKNQLYDTDQFITNVNNLNSHFILSTWTDLDIIKNEPVEEKFTKIIYEDKALDKTKFIDGEDKFTLKTNTDTSLDVHKYNVEKESYVDEFEIEIEEDLGTITRHDGSEVKKIAETTTDEYLFSVYKGLDTDKRTLNTKGDDDIKLKVRSTRHSHLGVGKLVTSFWTTDFIPVN